MKTTKAFLLAAIGLTAVFTACDSQKDETPTGSWESAAPVSVTAGVAGASSASKTMTITFVAPQGDAPGVVTVTADYDVALPASADSTAASSYKATATIKGTWARDGKEHDDYLLTFDRNSLAVNGVDAPELGPVTDEFLQSVSALASIEDVEVSKDGARMKFETDHPDVTYNFVRK